MTAPNIAPAGRVPSPFTPVVGAPEVSVLVSVDEATTGLQDLYEELAEAVRAMCESFEFVFVVEPAFDADVRPLAELARRGEPIRVVKVGQARGEASLLRVGVSLCRGAVLLTVPATRRVETAVIGRLLEAVRNGADLAVARRWPRLDPWVIRAQTRLFHSVVGRMVGGSGDGVNDIACGVRAMRRGLLDEIPLYGDLALFLPLLAARDGFRVIEVPAAQHIANYRSKPHPPTLYLRRLLDLLGLFFLVRFTEKPLRFFGLVGTAVAVPGAAILAVVFGQRLAGQGLADRPLLLLGVLLLVLGVQAIALGLVGEIIVHLHAAQRPTYRVRDGAEPRGPLLTTGYPRAEAHPSKAAVGGMGSQAPR